MLSRIGFGLLVAALLGWSVFPLWYAFVTSFSIGTATFQPHYLPPGFDPTNYADVLNRGHLLRAMANSAAVAEVSVILILVLSLFAAYPFARIVFPRRRLLLLSVLATTLFPPVAVLAGFYELFRALHLYNTLAAVIVTYILVLLPQTLWLLTAYLRAIPVEIEDMAVIDGATPFVIVTRILLPLIWPGMIATGLLAFIIAWNEFLFAFTFTMTEEQRTAPVAIALLWGYTPHDTPWGSLMAACVLTTLPPIALVVLFQRRMVSGLGAWVDAE